MVPRSTARPAKLRNTRAGAVRWYTQRRLPSAAPNAWIRLSLLRTSTSPSATSGVASTSLEAWAFHRSLPSTSNASTSPLTVATTTLPAPAAAPADRPARLAWMRHFCAPVPASKAASVPSAAAANTVPSEIAGVNKKLPAAPTPARQTGFNASVLWIGVRAAGCGPESAESHQFKGLSFCRPEQPDSNATTSMTTAWRPRPEPRISFTIWSKAGLHRPYRA